MAHNPALHLLMLADLYIASKRKSKINPGTVISCGDIGKSAQMSLLAATQELFPSAFFAIRSEIKTHLGCHACNENNRATFYRAN